MQLSLSALGGSRRDCMKIWVRNNNNITHGNNLIKYRNKLNISIYRAYILRQLISHLWPYLKNVIPLHDVQKRNYIEPE